MRRSWNESTITLIQSDGDPSSRRVRMPTIRCGSGSKRLDRDVERGGVVGDARLGLERRRRAFARLALQELADRRHRLPDRVVELAVDLDGGRPGIGVAATRAGGRAASTAVVAMATATKRTATLIVSGSTGIWFYWVLPGSAGFCEVRSRLYERWLRRIRET